MYAVVIRTLTNVRHVPNLKKSLIFLENLRSQGYKYFTEGGVLRVSEGAPMVIKGKLHTDLYFLQDNRFDGATAVSSSLNPNSDITHLCHMSLAI